MISACRYTQSVYVCCLFCSPAFFVIIIVALQVLNRFTYTYHFITWVILVQVWFGSAYVVTIPLHSLICVRRWRRECIRVCECCAWEQANWSGILDLVPCHVFLTQNVNYTKGRKEKKNEINSQQTCVPLRDIQYKIGEWWWQEKELTAMSLFVCVCACIFT